MKSLRPHGQLDKPFTIFNQNRSYRNILYRLYIFDKTLTVGRTFRNVATIFKHDTYSSDDMSLGTMHSISGVHTHACTSVMNTARRDNL